MKQEILEHLGINDDTLEKIKSLFEAEKDNPFSEPVVFPKYEVIPDDRISVEQLNQTIKPFLTQISKSQEKIEALIVEKTQLTIELNDLKTKEADLEQALDFSYQLILEKEDEIAAKDAEIEELTTQLSKRRWWKFWQ